MTDKKLKFWALRSDEVLSYLGTTLNGLSNEEAQQRLIAYHGKTLNGKEKHRTLKLLFSQFKSPILWILLFAVGLSFFLGDPADAIIILIIVVISGLLGFWQEYTANNSVAKLLGLVQIKSTVLRNGKPLEIGVMK